MLSEVERAARQEARLEARRIAKAAAREAKRQANKDAWKADPRNANVVWQQEQAALKAAAAIAPPADPDPDPGRGDNRSLTKLRAIMGDNDQPLYRRIEAAEIILQYELAPAALARGPVETVAATSFRFLQSVVDTPDTPDSLRFRALRCLASIENARAARVDGDQLAVKRELLRLLVNAERRRVIREAGSWDAAAVGWALTSADDWEWPEGWPGSWQWPPGDYGIRLDASKYTPAAELATRLDAWRAKLRSVRARNRADEWERLLAPEAV